MAIVVVNIGRLVPTPSGLVSEQYPDGNDGTTAPVAPQLNQPFAAGPTKVDLTLLSLPSGGTAPLVYYLQRSSTSDIAGFTDVANGASMFATDGKYQDTTASAATTYWYRLKVKDSAGSPRESVWSVVVTVTTPAVAGDVTAPSIPGVATFVEVNSTTLQVFSTGSTDNVAVQDYDVLLGQGNGAGVAIDAGIVVQTVTAFPAVIQNLTPAQEYYVRLRARDTSGNVSTAFSTAAFHTMAATPAARAGIIKTMDFSSFGTNKTNPPQSAWPASGTDFNNNKHIGQTGESFSAAAASAGYQALPHLEILSSWLDSTGATITPPNGGRAARCTLYYTAVDYKTGGYQGADKPRVDFHFSDLAIAHEGENWWGGHFWLPTNYVEDTDASKEFLLQWHPTVPPGVTAAANNSFVLYIKGGAGGNANWWLDCMDHGNTAAGDVDAANPDHVAFSLSTPVTTAQKGKHVYIVLHSNVIKATPSQNYMHMWLTQDPAEGQAAVHKSNTGTRFGVQKYATAEPSGNYYKGSWRNDGTYGGNKSGTSIIVLGEYRFGSSSSDYQSVHPTRQAQP